jgi:signal transduction histidine kinase
LYEDSGASDLSDVRRFNEAIDEALTESMGRFSVQRDLFRDQFIGVLSHDLRSPLGAIAGNAVLLGRPDHDPERRSQTTARIINSTQRMERLIDDLLDLTRARLGGSMPLTRQPADLRRVCEEALVEIGASQPHAAVRWEASGDLRGQWDADRLAQVIANLVGNAIQHGDGTPITLTGHDNGDSVTLTVHNRGLPIPPKALPFVFEPLARGQEDGGGVEHRPGPVHHAGDRIGTRRRYSRELVGRCGNVVHDGAAEGVTQKHL